MIQINYIIILFILIRKQLDWFVLFGKFFHISGGIFSLYVTKLTALQYILYSIAELPDVIMPAKCCSVVLWLTLKFPALLNFIFSLSKLLKSWQSVGWHLRHSIWEDMCKVRSFSICANDYMHTQTQKWCCYNCFFAAKTDFGEIPTFKAGFIDPA